MREWKNSHKIGVVVVVRLRETKILFVSTIDKVFKYLCSFVNIWRLLNTHSKEYKIEIFGFFFVFTYNSVSGFFFFIHSKQKAILWKKFLQIFVCFFFSLINYCISFHFCVSVTNISFSLFLLNFLFFLPFRFWIQLFVILSEWFEKLIFFFQLLIKKINFWI